ncbi:MAG: hypothetical protein LBI35_04465, partial [Burkholderiales bacterium]|nr:hypothetical protein [Burkholderiales bacterium]
MKVGWKRMISSEGAVFISHPVIGLMGIFSWFIGASFREGFGGWRFHSIATAERRPVHGLHSIFFANFCLYDAVRKNRT